MHEVLVNRLGGLSLPRKSVVRLTDRPDMTLDVYRGRKTTTKQNKRQLPFLKKRKEKRKYVARPGIEPRTPDLRVRRPTDCATRPGALERNWTLSFLPVLFSWMWHHFNFQKAFFLFSDWRLKQPNQNIKKAFQRQRRFGLASCPVDMKLTCTIAFQATYHCRVNICYLHGCRVNCLLSPQLPGEQVFIHQAAG